MNIKRDNVIATNKGNDLLKLYEIVIQEEHYFLEAHQNRVAFYAGIVTALLGALIVGTYNAKEWQHFAFLSIIPLLIFAFSIVFTNGITGIYLRFIEAITIRAKIEQQLGLTMPQITIVDEGSYWQTEPLIPQRYINSRKSFQTSDEFINVQSRRGYHATLKIISRILQFVCVILFFGLVFMAYVKYP